MMGNNLLTMWKGERGGGRGTFLGGGQALAPVLGLDLVVTGVWLLLLLPPSRGATEEFGAEDEDAICTGAEGRTEERAEQGKHACC